MRLQRWGGRKLTVTPQRTLVPTPKPRRDESLIKALVRAHRWRRTIESGNARPITDPAEQEGATAAYVCRRSPAI
jgi:site-specific DNA recombinase